MESSGELRAARTALIAFLDAIVNGTDLQQSYSMGLTYHIMNGLRKRAEHPTHRDTSERDRRARELAQHHTIMPRRIIGLEKEIAQLRACLSTGAVAVVEGGEKAKRGNVKKGLAAAIAVDCWQDIEIKVLASGIKYRKAGTGEKFITKTWGAIAMDKTYTKCALLIEIAKGSGTFLKRKGENRWNAVSGLNKAFRGAFGLNESPFFNAGKLGTQTFIGAISWDGTP